MNKSVLSFLCLLVFIFGCPKEYVYISVVDVPPNPRFSVMPGNNSVFEVEYAGYVEKLLISCGVRVRLSPNIEPNKEVVTERGVTENVAEAEGEAAIMTTEKVIERSYDFGSIGADYILTTSRTSQQVRCVEVKTQDVLWVIEISDWYLNRSASVYTDRQESKHSKALQHLRNVLSTAGFTVANPIK